MFCMMMRRIFCFSLCLLALSSAHILPIALESLEEVSTLLAVPHAVQVEAADSHAQELRSSSTFDVSLGTISFQISTPQVFLYTPSGSAFAANIDAAADRLALGSKYDGLASARADAGPDFYKEDPKMWSVSDSSSMPFQTKTSEVLTCFGINYIYCSIHNSSNLWTQLPKLQISKDVNCGNSDLLCNGNLFSTWSSAMAYLDSTTGGLLVVKVLELFRGSHWLCWSGCAANATASSPSIASAGRCGPQFGDAVCDCRGSPASSIVWCCESSGWCGDTSQHRACSSGRFDRNFSCAPPTIGSKGIIIDTTAAPKSLVLNESFVMIGYPGYNNGTGKVDVWQAIGTPSGNGTGSEGLFGMYNRWLLVSSLKDDKSSAFGSYIAIRANLVAISAPSYSQASSSVHIYSNLASSGIERVCTIQSPTPNAQFGLAIAIQQHESQSHKYIVFVGSPSENRVYAVNVNLAPTTLIDQSCEAASLLRIFKSQDTSYAWNFGYSVGATGRFVFVGTPSYTNAQSGYFYSGLLMVFTCCFPGEYYDSVSSSCFICGEGTWSAGGQQSACTSCIPQHARQISGCNYTCLSGFFGRDCQVCSVAMQGTYKPLYSHWVDGLSTCEWACDQSFFPSNGSCVTCGNITDLNGVYDAVGCSWTCKKGFFNFSNSTSPICRSCSEYKARVGEAAPPHAQWVDGISTCTFGPLLGYKCNGSNCTPCEQPLVHAHWLWKPGLQSEQCDRECDRGFFARLDGASLSCLTCSQLQQAKAPSEQISLPARAAWNDNTTTCDANSWQCLPGNLLSATDKFCCPVNISNSKANANSRPCGVECLLGFWWDLNSASCLPCSPLPLHTEWAGPNCLFRALPGYTCGAEGCQACSVALPPHAEFVQAARDCEFRCDQTYFGHPDYQGVCVKCSVLLTQVVPPSQRVELPRHAVWLDNVTSCSLDSWECDEGYTEDKTFRLCCPLNIPNARAGVPGAPCSVECLPGFSWNASRLSCQSCPALPDKADRFIAGCDFVCKAGSFLTQDKLCVDCRTLQESAGTALPPHAFWPLNVNLSECTRLSWECDDLNFFKSLAADPPGCCPRNLTEGAEPSDSVRTCNYQCQVGWRWDSAAKLCVRCPSQVTPPSSDPSIFFWNFTACLWECEQDWYPYPPASASPDRCVDCAELATLESWQKPANSEWALPAHETSCRYLDWTCKDGFFLQLQFSLCCSQSDFFAPFNLQANFEWLPNSCSWQCLPGYFPTTPRRDWNNPAAGGNCLTCSEYLNKFQVPLLGSDVNKVSANNPSSCTAVVTVKFMVSKITVSDFSLARESSLLSLIASVVGVSSQLVKLSAISSSIATRQVAAVKQLLSITVNVVQLDPQLVSSVISSLQGIKSDTNFQSFSSSFGSDWQLKTVEATGGDSAWSCRVNYVKNAETGSCCQASSFWPPASDPSTYVWVGSCQWQCRGGYIQEKLTGRCISCDLYQSRLGNSKPLNSHWTSSQSQPCGNWECDTGYVPSSSGSECLLLSSLRIKCSALNRCVSCSQIADCVWCNESCVPGTTTLQYKGCPYDNSGTAQPCSCDITCPKDCAHDSCSSCIDDSYCGWCSTSSKCMIGNDKRPQYELCSYDWIRKKTASCPSSTQMWLIAMICATCSTAVVGSFGGYAVLRLKLAIRRRERQDAEYVRRREQLLEMTRTTMHNFPTFKFHANNRVRPRDKEDEDEKPTCSICLGEFAEGEELKSLPCVHVFHCACIDQWLRLSSECPLCKRSVLANADQSADAQPFVAAQAQAFEIDPTAAGAPPRRSLRRSAAQADTSSPQLQDGWLMSLQESVRAMSQTRSRSYQPDGPEAQQLNLNVPSAASELDTYQPSVASAAASRRLQVPNLRIPAVVRSLQQDEQAEGERDEEREEETSAPSIVSPHSEATTSSSGSSPRIDLVV